MKYEVSIERSAELLRKAIPLMTKQAAAMHPVSYAIWYEYVARENLPLMAAMDQAIARHGQLDEAATQALFQQHVSEFDPESGQRMADGVHRLLSNMADSAAQAGAQTAQFGNSLSRLSTELSAELPSAVSDVLAQTKDMQSAMQRLQSRLDASLQEINTLRTEAQRARHEALIDSLTGLANRRAFGDQLGACIAAHSVDPQGYGLCLVAGDIDHFKTINDRYGHGFGDQVLRAVGKVLRSAAHAPAVAARVGGEEFALLLPATSLADATALAEQVRATVAASRVRRKDGTVIAENLTISLGVTAYVTGEPETEFIERADQAMYESKRGGRNRVTVM